MTRTITKPVTTPPAIAPAEPDDGSVGFTAKKK